MSIPATGLKLHPCSLIPSRGTALSPSHRMRDRTRLPCDQLHRDGRAHAHGFERYSGGALSLVSPPIRTAEAVSAFTRAILKTTASQVRIEGDDDKLRRAEHLRNAIEQRAREQGHKAPDIARILDISVGHWYRIRKEPFRLDRIDLPRVGAIANYIGWPRVQVLIAIGWLEQQEVDQVLSGTAVLSRTLRRLHREGIAGGVSTPLGRAAPDHRVLMARLLLAAESRVISRAS
jgi:hypothetical protein